MTSWSERRRGEDVTWQYDRTVARTVPCVDCPAVEGEDCRNLRTGAPLEHQAAHQKRIDAGHVRAAEDSDTGIRDARRTE